MKIAIDRIKVAARIRKHISNVDDLAANIRENGLITPIAVMQLDGGEYQLLAGLRRIRAMELNGEIEIDAKVFPASDAESALKIEYFENEQREPFTYSEKMGYAAVIAEIEKAKAAERKSAGIRLPDNDLPPLGAGGKKRETRNIVGAKIGMSGTQYDRARYIADNAPPDVIEQLDRGERTIRRTYDELRAKEKTAMSPTLPTSVQVKSAHSSQSNGVQTKVHANPSSLPLASSLPSAKDDPLLAKLQAEEAEAVRLRQAFDALSPQGKIAELQRQLKEARVRALGAESDLARLKELRHNDLCHMEATIESLKRQNAELNEALEAAQARILELEESQHHDK